MTKLSWYQLQLCSFLSSSFTSVITILSFYYSCRCWKLYLAATKRGESSSRVLLFTDELMFAHTNLVDKHVLIKPVKYSCISFSISIYMQEFLFYKGYQDHSSQSG